MKATKRFMFVLTVVFCFGMTFTACEDCEECEAVGSNETKEFCDDELDTAKESAAWEC